MKTNNNKNEIQMKEIIEHMGPDILSDLESVIEGAGLFTADAIVPMLLDRFNLVKDTRMNTNGELKYIGEHYPLNNFAMQVFISKHLSEIFLHASQYLDKMSKSYKENLLRSAKSTLKNEDELNYDGQTFAFYAWEEITDAEENHTLKVVSIASNIFNSTDEERNDLLDKLNEKKEADNFESNDHFIYDFLQTLQVNNGRAILRGLFQLGNEDEIRKLLDAASTDENLEQNSINIISYIGAELIVYHRLLLMGRTPIDFNI